MEYKVVKEFGSAKKGDVLTVDECGFASFDITEKNGRSEYTRAMTIDENTADDLVENGYLVELDDDCCCEDCPCKKIEDTVELIDNLLGQYSKDHEDVLKKAEKGEVQPCVKVEAETVYYNLSKVLNKIKKELTNE